MEQHEPNWQMLFIWGMQLDFTPITSVLFKFKTLVAKRHPTAQLLHGQYCTSVLYFKIAHLQLTNNFLHYSVFVRSLVYMNYQAQRASNMQQLVKDFF